MCREYRLCFLRIAARWPPKASEENMSTMLSYQGCQTYKPKRNNHLHKALVTLTSSVLKLRMGDQQID